MWSRTVGIADTNFDVPFAENSALLKLFQPRVGAITQLRMLHSVPYFRSCVRVEVDVLGCPS